jgi:NAD(P)-dependent dehydrogenase (short-subunit alcohol dehydrogenase family)
VDLRRLLDDALEVSVVGSFSRVGYLARRRIYGWPDPPPGALAGRTVLVTGPTSGLGRATSEAIADLGARVILLGRSLDRLQALSTQLMARHGADRFPCVVADMSSLSAVGEAVERIRSSEARLDVLVDNAGAINPRRELSADGIEATFATMVVGPFVLIGGLLPLLEASSGRVISVVSGGLYAQPLDVEDLQYEGGTHDGTRAYARAKRASVTLTRAWGRRAVGRGIGFTAMHSGWADTPGFIVS